MANGNINLAIRQLEIKYTGFIKYNWGRMKLNKDFFEAGTCCLGALFCDWKVHKLENPFQYLAWIQE